MSSPAVVWDGHTTSFRTEDDPAVKWSETEQVNGWARTEGEGSIQTALIPVDETLPKKNRWSCLLVSSQPKGRQWTSSSRKPRVRKCDLGKLARVLQLPLELFREIASYLNPIDLLHLSRTSSDLRAYLVSKHAKQIWTACEHSVGLPPCPSDLCEPRYVNLLFEKECHACGCLTRAKRIDALRIRLCDDCKKLNVSQGKKIAEEEFGQKTSQMLDIYSLVPCTGPSNYFNSAMMLGPYLERKERLFLKYDFISIVKRYLDTQPDSKEREDFIKAQNQLVEGITKSVNEITSWELKRERDRLVMREAIQSKRVEKIKENLSSIGYSSTDIDRMSTFSFETRDIRKVWKNHVYQPRELTDLSWSRLRPKLEPLLLEARRIEHERIVKQNREKRTSELFIWYKDIMLQPPAEASPVTLCFVDLLKIPAVTEIIEEDGCSLPLTPDRLAPIEQELPDLIKEHSKKVVNDCSRLLAFAQQKARLPENVDSQPPVPEANIDPDNIWKASAFFGPFRGTHLLSTFSDVLSLRYRNIFKEPGEWGAWEAWDSSKIGIDLLIIRAANALLASLGYPDDTTMEHMENLGRSFICQQCEPSSRTRMSWRFLVGHLCNEIKKYRDHASTFQANKLSFIETHKIETDGTLLALYDPDFIENFVGCQIYLM